jgi:translocation and assembly module TamB
MRALRLMLVALGGMVGVAAVAFGALQLHPVQHWLLNQTARAVAGERGSAELGAVAGIAPFDLRIDALRLHDADGEWLSLRNFEVSIDPAALLRGRLVLRRLTAEALVIARLPAGAASAQPQPHTSKPLTLPRLPIGIVLEHLQVADIRLGPDLLGEPVALAIDGHARLAGADATARLAVRRIDGAAGQADLALSLAGEPAYLAVELTAAEPSGVLLAHLLGRSDRPPLDVTLRGAGPLANWRGNLRASAGELAWLEADVSLAAADAYRVGLNGRASIAPLLPDRFAPAIADRVSFGGQLSATPDGDVRIEWLTLETAGAQAGASGTYTAATNVVAADATLIARDVALLSDIAGQPLAGGVAVRLTAAGQSTRPELRVEIHGEDLRIAEHGAQRLAASLTLGADGDVGNAATRYLVTGEGRVEGFAAAPWLPADAATWRFAASLDGAARNVELRLLEVAMPGVNLSGHANVRDGGAAVDGEAELNIADLALLSDLAGRSLGGSGRMKVQLRTAASGVVDASISGSLNEARLGAPMLDAVLAGAVELAGAGRRAADGTLHVENFTVSGTHLRLAADGELSPSQALRGRVTADLPQLAVLGRALGTPMGGRLRVDARADGPIAVLAVKGDLDATQVTFGTQSLDRLHAKIDATAGERVNGRIDGTFRAGALDGRLDAVLALNLADRVLDITRLHLAANGSTLDGKLRTALDSGLTRGTIAARFDTLAPWSSLAGVALAGRGEAKATLGGKTRQDVDIELKGSRLALGDLAAVGQLVLRAQLTDLLGKPRGNAKLDIGKAKLADAEVTSLSLQLTANQPGRVGFEVSAEGRYREPFTLAAGGDIALERGREVLRLARLSGTLAGEPIRLRQPLAVTRKDADVLITDLALAVGRGQLAGSGMLQGERLGLALKAERLPIGLAARFAGRPEVSGTLSVDAQLEGTRARPLGRMAVQVQDLRQNNGRRGNGPAVGIAADAAWRDGRVELKGRVSGPEQQAISFSGSAPLELAPKTLAVSVPSAKPIALSVTGEGELAALQELLPIGEDRMAGRFGIDIRIAGTLADPAASGTLTLRGGRYDSMATGTVLRDLSLELVGDRRQFVLRKLEATDGERGRLNASGAVDLAATPGPAVNAQVQLQSFRALRHDNAQMTASGAMQVRGPLTALNAVARLRVEQAELRLPDRLPSRVTALDVVEINSVTGERKAEPPPPQSAGLAVALDIKVDLPGRVYVRGRGLDGEWRGDLAVTGSSAAPVVVGALRAVRGTVSVLDRTFTLTRGTITFTGGTRIDPSLDILAEVAAGEVTGTVQLAGTAMAPTIKIGSQPEMPQDEVLARILFGKSISQITPAQGLRLAAAAASLVRGGPGFLDKMRGSLGLDRFEVGGGDAGKQSGGGGLGGATVTAGKYIAEGVYVGVDQGTSTSSSRAKVEIELRPNISMETKVGATGGNAIGLNWKMDY